MSKEMSLAPGARKLLPLLAMVAALHLPAAAQMGSQSASAVQNQDNPDALTALNMEFRTLYSQARDSCTARTLPLIICVGDKMSLIDKDLRLETTIIPPKYTQLKVVDHIPLALFVLLESHCGEVLDEKTRQELDKIKKLTLEARPVLATVGLDAPTLERQHQLIDQSLAFLDSVQKKQKVSKAELISFCRELKPMVMKNVDQAVAAQLKIMDDTIYQWREKLGAERFGDLTVVIVSGHMPRERHTCFQYFSKLMHVKREGLKIVYSEGSDQEQAARELVGTHVLDASIGETFFKERLRMHRDLLSDGAARYLSAHPPLSAHQRKKQR